MLISLELRNQYSLMQVLLTVLFLSYLGAVVLLVEKRHIQVILRTHHSAITTYKDNEFKSLLQFFIGGVIYIQIF